jgi:hypothetical protein
VKLFGKKVIRKIDFGKIKKAQLEENIGFEDISIKFFLVIDKSTNSGASRQEEIILSQFSSNDTSRNKYLCRINFTYMAQKTWHCFPSRL